MICVFLDLLLVFFLNIFFQISTVGRIKPSSSFRWSDDPEEVVFRTRNRKRQFQPPWRVAHRVGQGPQLSNSVLQRGLWKIGGKFVFGRQKARRQLLLKFHFMDRFLKLFNKTLKCLAKLYFFYLFIDILVTRLCVKNIEIYATDMFVSCQSPGGNGIRTLT